MDKGLYGFQISETYAYLPCYEDFLADIARALYGSAVCISDNDISRPFLSKNPAFSTYVPDTATICLN